MGSGRWEPEDWKSYKSAHVSGKTTREVYSKGSMDADLDPSGVGIRESRDSTDNPESNAIIIGLDVTGSMHSVLDSMARKGLPTLCTEIYKRKPVSDPQIMCMGIGDCHVGDQAPLQATQFETDIRIAEQLQKIWLEGGGGGNGFESYNLPWYFAGSHTSIDCFEKRGKKGYLFTIGDEYPPESLSPSDIKRVFGDIIQSGISLKDLLALAERTYHVFHIMVEEGSHYRHYGNKVKDKWQAVLGERAIGLSDHTKLAEVIVSTIQLTEGMNADTIVETWDGSTSVAVKHALKGMSGAIANVDVDGLIKL